MADSETRLAGLPVPLQTRRARPSLLRNQTAAAFVSQLLAARAQLPPQRARRRGNAEGAIGAYSDGAQVGIKRMPAGYRMTRLA